MLNNVSLIGRLTADPELRVTSGNAFVTTFTVAVSRSYVKAGAQRETDFIDIVAWSKTAEFICKYFIKGQQVAITGSIQTRSYTDKEGAKRRAFEVVADRVDFCESKDANRAKEAAKTESQLPEKDEEDFSQVLEDEDLPF